MRILVTLSRFPYPTDKGDKLRAYYQVKELSRRHSVALFCLTDQPVSAAERAELEGFCETLEIIPHSRGRIIANVASAAVNRLPLQVAYFRSPEFRQRVSRYVSQNAVDICYVQLARMSENIPSDLGAPVYLDYMDAFSLNAARRAEGGPLPVRLVAAVEASRMRAYEERIADRFDGLSIITTQDAAVFSKRVRRRIDIVANGVGPHFFDPAPAIDRSFDIIFSGNMGYAPNVQAAKYLVREVVPLLRRRDSPVRICLAGTHPDKEVQRLASDSVTVTGFVEDIRSYLRAARVCAAPLLSGSGLQNKLLEAMAAGLPTVTTALANQPLGASPGRQVLVGDAAASIAQHIDGLLDDPEAARRLGEAGRAFVHDTFEWSARTRVLEESLARIAMNRAEECAYGRVPTCALGGKGVAEALAGQRQRQRS
ncbi:MAG: glycosyltransferase [Capsulimonadaceae bacterium]